MGKQAPTKAIQQVLEWAETELADIEARLQNYERLRSRAAELQGIIALNRKLLGARAEAKGPGLPGGQTADVARENRPGGMTIAQGVQRVMEEAGRPMRVPEIVTAMRGLGFFRNVKYPASNVSTALARNPESFEKVKKGLFRLKISP
jgi:hypothetical protein